MEKAGFKMSRWWFRRILALSAFITLLYLPIVALFRVAEGGGSGVGFVLGFYLILFFGPVATVAALYSLYLVHLSWEGRHGSADEEVAELSGWKIALLFAAAVPYLIPVIFFGLQFTGY